MTRSGEGWGDWRVYASVKKQFLFRSCGLLPCGNVGPLFGDVYFSRESENEFLCEAPMGVSARANKHVSVLHVQDLLGLEPL